MRGATSIRFSDTPADFNFNPHSPCGERLYWFECRLRCVCNFNPHSPCGERPEPFTSISCAISISIHTPHAGSDYHVNSDFCTCQIISIHTPHAGSDASFTGETIASLYFNPHSPCGERQCCKQKPRQPPHFNPHSPCGERHYTCTCTYSQQKISIHTPHAGSDVKRLTGLEIN